MEIMHNYLEIVYTIENQIKNSSNDEWKKILDDICDRSLHIAIMIEPYLSLILDGSKTIESRISINMISPHKQIKEKDLVILKKSGGSIKGIFEAGTIHFYCLDDKFTIRDLKKKYNKQLLIEEDFWERKTKSKFATLIEVNHVLNLEPIECRIPNRRSWISLTNINMENNTQMTFYNSNNSFNKYIPYSIICIAGKVASGKTSLSTMIAEKLQCNHYSVSDYLKSKALLQGYQIPDRSVLQKIGAECMEEGWDKFVSDFLSFTKNTSKDRLVIDGIRHKEFYESLKKLFQENSTLVYLETDEKEIMDRMISRSEVNFDFSHIAEGKTDELKAISDYSITTGNKSVQEISDELLLLLASK